MGRACLGPTTFSSSKEAPVYSILVCRWDDVTSFIISGCTIIVILYLWFGVRGIPWSRVRVRVLARCRVMVLAFTAS